MTLPEKPPLLSSWEMGGWRGSLAVMEFPSHSTVGHMCFWFISLGPDSLGAAGNSCYWGSLVGSVERIVLGLGSYPHLYTVAGFVGRATFQSPIELAHTSVQSPLLKRPQLTVFGLYLRISRECSLDAGHLGFSPSLNKLCGS